MGADITQAALADGYASRAHILERRDRHVITSSISNDRNKFQLLTQAPVAPRKAAEETQECEKGLFDYVTDVVGGAAGVVTGTASMALHIVPGVVSGAHEALADVKGQRNGTPFHGTLATQNALLGLGAGIAAEGVFGGLGGVAVGTAATYILEGKAEKTNAYEKMIERIENKVGWVYSADPSITVDKVIEGTIIGGVEAVKTGAQVGYAVGFDAVKAGGEVAKAVGRKVEWAAERTVGDAVVGVAKGTCEAGKDIVLDAMGQGEKPAEILNPERTGLRRAVGALVGAPLGLANIVTSATSGPLMGAFTGLGHEGGGMNLLLQDSVTLLGFTGAGAGVGGAVAGVPGAVVGGVTGLLYATLVNKSDANEQIAHDTAAKVIKAVDDNDPQAYFVERTMHDLTEGTLTGTVFNSIEGYKKGVDTGAGIVAGLVDGTRGFMGAVAGNYLDPSATPASTDAGLARKALRGAVGTVTGTVGSAMSLVDGVIQGSSIALDSQAKASASFHEGLYSATAMTAAGAAGYVLGGGIGQALAGVLVAAAGARLVHKMNERTGASQKVADGITSAVRHAQQDNSYLNQANHKKNVYEVFRDTVEGTMTAGGAGIREGFGEGYDLGSGFVDGVFNSVRDVSRRMRERFQ